MSEQEQTPRKTLERWLLSDNAPWPFQVREAIRAVLAEARTAADAQAEAEQERQYVAHLKAERDELRLDLKQAADTNQDLLLGMHRAEHARDALRAERDKYRDALIARHGGEPIALLHELDAARAEVDALLAGREIGRGPCAS